MELRQPAMRVADVIPFLLAAVLALASTAVAQGVGEIDLTGGDLPVQIIADEIHYDSKDMVYTAEGRVRISQKERSLAANWVMLDAESRIGVASGNVLLKEGDEIVRSDFMEFNIDTLVGVVYHGRFDDAETHFRVTGSEIRRVADKEYRLKHGTFTTCDCGPGQVPSWSIEGNQIDLTVDGYAKVRDARFKVRDKTIVRIPYGFFPVKSTRQSGFLFPAIGQSSRNGFEFNLPYYWAISENTDATFYNQILGKRGYKQGVEYRYIYSPDTYGQANFWYLNDQDIGDDSPFNENRWAMRWQARQKLPFGIRGKADVDLVSDNQYPIDFQDVGRDSNRFLEAKGHLERPFERGLMRAGIIYGDDLQSPDDLDRDKFVLNRFPYVQADLLVQPVFNSPLHFEWTSSFVNFQQRDDPKDEFGNTFPGTGGTGRLGFFDTGVDGLFDLQEQAFNSGNPDPDRDDFLREVVVEECNVSEAECAILGLPTTGFIHNPNGTERDGIFQEGEILANAGQRIDFYPRVSLPMRLGKYLSIRPEVGFRETIWQSDDFHDSTTHRDLVTGRIDFTTQLEKEWTSIPGPWESLHQTMIPRLTVFTIQGSDDELIDELPPPGGLTLVDRGKFDVTSVTGSSLVGNQNVFRSAFEGKSLLKVNHPVFVPPGSTNQSRQRYFAIDNVLQDQSDVIPDQTVIFYGLENQFFTRSSGEDSESRRVLRIRAGTGYDVENDLQIDSILEASLDPSDNLQLFANATYNNEIDQLDKFGIGGVLSTNRGDRLGLGYRLSKSFAETFEDFQGDVGFEEFEEDFDEISELNSNLRIRLLDNLDFLYKSNYSFDVNEFFRQAYTIVYRSKCDCWSTNFSVVDRRRANDTEVRILVNLMGLGAIGNASNP